MSDIEYLVVAARVNVSNLNIFLEFNPCVLGWVAEISHNYLCRWWQLQQYSTSTTGPRKEIRVQQPMGIHILISWEKNGFNHKHRKYHNEKVPTTASHDMWRRPDWLRARAIALLLTVQYSATQNFETRIGTLFSNAIESLQTLLPFFSIVLNSALHNF